MIVFVHGYNSDGFIRPLERNSDKVTEANLARRQSTVLFCSIWQKLQKIDKKHAPADVSQELNCLYFKLLLCITTLELKGLSIVSLSIDSLCCYKFHYISWIYYRKTRTHTQDTCNKIGLTNNTNTDTKYSRKEPKIEANHLQICAFRLCVLFVLLRLELFLPLVTISPWEETPLNIRTTAYINVQDYVLYS